MLLHRTCKAFDSPNPIPIGFKLNFTSLYGVLQIFLETKVWGYSRQTTESNPEFICVRNFSSSKNLFLCASVVLFSSVSKCGTYFCIAIFFTWRLFRISAICIKCIINGFLNRGKLFFIHWNRFIIFTLA